MCGIVGYVGSQQVVEVLLDTLSSLEYRGYDSSGISVEKDNKIYTVKSRGPLSALKAKLASVDLSGSICGVGHTRWATHGEPSDVNAHPHGTRKLSLVHNGIIENYRQIKEELLEQGYTFESQTDTEVAAKYLKKGNPVYVEGRLRTRNWEENGLKRYVTEVEAQNLIMLGGKRNEAPTVIQGVEAMPKVPEKLENEPEYNPEDDPTPF